MYITASGRCAPPKNKPTSEELDNCQPYLERELEIIQPKVIVCLGKIGFDRIRKIFSVGGSAVKFGHGATYRLENGTWLLGSYHPSQQNTQTRKLTVEMFDNIWEKAKKLCDE
jgi:uracil-DNA glycosylase family 4